MIPFRICGQLELPYNKGYMSSYIYHMKTFHTGIHYLFSGNDSAVVNLHLYY